MPQNSNQENRSNILQTITTPIKLAGLFFLVTEALMITLAFKLEPKHAFIAYLAMVVILIITVVGILLVVRQKEKQAEPYIIPYPGNQQDPRANYQYDMFLAAPMAALDGKDFVTVNSMIKNIKKIIEEKYRYKVFYAGSEMETAEDFQKVDLSLEIDIQALIQSKRFMMIYPEKIVSSVLAEAGMALALGKPSYYFGKINNLPFLLKEAHENERYKHVKLYEMNTIEEVTNFLEKDRNNIFNL